MQGAARGVFLTGLLRTLETAMSLTLAVTAGSLHISPNRAHANRAITPVALGIEPNFSGLANSVAKKCPGPLPGCGAKKPND